MYLLGDCGIFGLEGMKGIIQSLDRELMCYIYFYTLVLLVIKNLPANAGDVRDMGLISGLGRSLEKSMSIRCSILAWRIPGTEEPGGLWSRGLQRIGCDRNDSIFHLCSELSRQDTYGSFWSSILVLVLH